MLIGDTVFICRKQFGSCNCEKCKKIESDIDLRKCELTRRCLTRLLFSKQDYRISTLAQRNDPHTFLNQPALKPGRSLMLIPLLLLLQTTLIGACSSKKTVERSTITEDSSPGYNGARSYERTEETTVKTETTDTSDCSGILSCTVDTIGTILAFPFKVAGVVIGAIF